MPTLPTRSPSASVAVLIEFGRRLPLGRDAVLRLGPRVEPATVAHAEHDLRPTRPPRDRHQRAARGVAEVVVRTRRVVDAVLAGAARRPAFEAHELELQLRHVEE